MILSRSGYGAELTLTDRLGQGRHYQWDQLSSARFPGEARIILCFGSGLVRLSSSVLAGWGSIPSPLVH
jgi:hypothetical protein